MSIIKNIYKKSGIILQTANNSCGACAVGNLHMLRTGERLSEEELLKYVKTEPFPVGCENDDVVRGLEKLGYSIIEEKSSGTIGEIENLLESGKLVIVNYYNPFQNVGHYGVVEDFDEEYVYLYDSIFGIYRLDKAAFERVWHSYSRDVKRWFIAIGE